jgi:hypothetical protein
VATLPMLAAGTLMIAGCSSSRLADPTTSTDSAPSSSPTPTASRTAPAPPPTTSPLPTASVPTGTVSSREGTANGCLDQRGTVSAAASSWYRVNDVGVVDLGGTQVETTAITAFADMAARAVAGALPDAYNVAGHDERVDNSGGCTTLRSAFLTRSDGAAIYVSAWRLEHSANPSWIANEAPFTVIDDHTVESVGPHLTVLLVVASDGTTIRVSAYGTGMTARVQGWPSTFVLPADTPDPGPVPATADQLLTIAKQAASAVTEQQH